MSRIRRAEPADAAALARLAEATFRDTFAADNRAEDMDAHCTEVYGEAQQAREIVDPAVVTLVAVDGGELAAYAQLRVGSATASVSAALPVEIHRFYVDREHHGRGLAAELMARALEEAVALGCDGLWLGVWERNPRAIRFYEKHGFETVGEHVFQLGSDAQRDLVMVRRGGG